MKIKGHVSKLWTYKNIIIIRKQEKRKNKKNYKIFKKGSQYNCDRVKIMNNKKQYKITLIIGLKREGLPSIPIWQAEKDIKDYAIAELKYGSLYFQKGVYVMESTGEIIEEDSAVFYINVDEKDKDNMSYKIICMGKEFKRKYNQESVIYQIEEINWAFI